MGYAPKTHFKKTVQKLLAFTMANTNPKHPCMNHGKCKLKKTAFTMGNANSRFFVFTMANAHFKHAFTMVNTYKKNRCYLVIGRGCRGTYVGYWRG